MNTQFGILFFCTLLFMTSCASDTAQKIDLTQAPIHLKKLAGNWKVNGAEEFEIWYPSDGFPFKGAIFAGTNKKDDLIIEQVGNEVLYQAKVFNKNGGKILGFKMTKCDQNGVTFENKNHDFPNTISYEFVDANNMTGVVSGERDAQPIEMKLKFERTN